MRGCVGDWKLTSVWSRQLIFLSLHRRTAAAPTSAGDGQRRCSSSSHSGRSVHRPQQYGRAARDGQRRVSSLPHSHSLRLLCCAVLYLSGVPRCCSEAVHPRRSAAPSHRPAPAVPAAESPSSTASPAASDGPTRQQAVAMQPLRSLPRISQRADDDCVTTRCGVHDCSTCSLSGPSRVSLYSIQ